MKAQNPYIPFARKYRPTKFSELRGQHVLTKTLNNAIANDRLAQGYLLCGIRGVGKTTTARIIAKTINCTSNLVEEQNISPCEVCQNCVAFNESSHPDIIEVDAASRTSVDDVRQIINHSEYKPLLGHYKIFIIDEVHMLSKSAFNALLKLLEEPPAHILFIFATTEVQKIPLTVISRCQRYDLPRLKYDEIVNLLSFIAKNENIKYEPDALNIIASRSDGSARDAVTMFDQAVSLSFNDASAVVQAELVNNMLGLVSLTRVIEFLGFVIQGDAGIALDFIKELYNSSQKLEGFVSELSDLIAYMTKRKLIYNYSEVAYSSYSPSINLLLDKVSVHGLSILWQIFSTGVSEVMAANNQLIATEMLVIKAIYSKSIPEFEGSEQEEVLKDSKAKASASKNVTQVSGEVTAPQTVSSDDIKTGVPTSLRDMSLRFLEYLHANNEMEIYYILLNMVEFIRFADSKLELNSEDCNNNIKLQISNLLFAWTGNKWDVIINKVSPATTVKNQLMDKVKTCESWSSLDKNFPGAEVSDVLLKV